VTALDLSFSLDCSRHKPPALSLVENRKSGDTTPRTSRNRRKVGSVANGLSKFSGSSMIKFRANCCELPQKRSFAVFTCYTYEFIPRRQFSRFRDQNHPKLLRLSSNDMCARLQRSYKFSVHLSYFLSVTVCLYGALSRSDRLRAF